MGDRIFLSKIIDRAAIELIVITSKGKSIGRILFTAIAR